MSKRNVKKQFWFSREEAQLLQSKAKKACLNEASLVRMLVKEYTPKEKPSDDFYDAMSRISEFGNAVNLLADKAKLEGVVDVDAFKKEAKKWHEFQADIERRFLRPDGSDMKWQ